MYLTQAKTAILVPVPNIRPAVISQDTYEQLNEFRGFRHVSRNLYAYDLDHQRIIDLANKLIGCHQIFIYGRHEKI